MKFARSPWEDTSIAPKIETSTWPPLIIPKDSEESNTDAPGTRVTVSFPALMMSLLVSICQKGARKERTHASTWSFVGYGPIPKIPFSDCNQTFTPGSV